MDRLHKFIFLCFIAVGCKTGGVEEKPVPSVFNRCSDLNPQYKFHLVKICRSTEFFTLKTLDDQKKYNISAVSSALLENFQNLLSQSRLTENHMSVAKLQLWLEVDIFEPNLIRFVQVLKLQGRGYFFPSDKNLKFQQNGLAGLGYFKGAEYAGASFFRADQYIVRISKNRKEIKLLKDLTAVARPDAVRFNSGFATVHMTPFAFELLAKDKELKGANVIPVVYRKIPSMHKLLLELPVRFANRTLKPFSPM